MGEQSSLGDCAFLTNIVNIFKKKMNNFLTFTLFQYILYFLNVVTGNNDLLIFSLILVVCVIYCTLNWPFMMF